HVVKGRTMKKAIVIILVLVGLLAVGAAGIGALYGIGRLVTRNRVPGTTILEVNLETGFVEDVPNESVADVMFKGTPRVRDFVEALERAGDDDRVVGLIATIGGGGQGMAVLQEFRDAVEAFRAKGKFALAFSETFGEAGPGNGGYYLATAFDEIWLQPSGDLGLTGLSAEPMFLRRALGKLGMTPHFDHRYEYKNAMNMFTETKMTDAHREATTDLMNVQFRQIVDGIAEARKLSSDAVRELFDGGPLLGEQALDAGLVDHMGYRDEAYAAMREHAGKRGRLLYLKKYLEMAGRPHTHGPTLALIYGVGPVQRGPSGYSALFGSASMGSDTVAAAFRDAIKDDDVRGILFRVDSPGGSAVASDVIWRQTIRARDAGKPVVVSMGNVAASGGYWISMDAAKIVAQPGTITSSIGVLSGKFLTAGFWDWLGIDWDGVYTSKQGTLYDGLHDYSDLEWASFQEWLDRIYSDFTRKVAAGRDLPLERVKEIAKGRVWTGEEALDRGLVDALGGFPEAIRLLKEEIGIAADAPVTLRKFPKEKTTWQKLLSNDPASSDELTARALVSILRQVQPVAGGLRDVVVPPAAHGPVYAPVSPEVE
ncbi:MAG: S49 family peptidase, partial [Acidobacteriota bacterium]